jgi:hypothetical protein
MVKATLVDPAILLPLLLLLTSPSAVYDDKCPGWPTLSGALDVPNHLSTSAHETM